MTIVRNPPQPANGRPPLPATVVRVEAAPAASEDWPTSGPAPDDAGTEISDPRSNDESWCDQAAASLAAAARAADEAAAGVAAVQRAGATLVDEVRQIRDALAAGRIVIERLRRRVAAEASAATAARAAAAALAREHARLIEEHDAFLAAILEEEEEARRALRAEQTHTEARLAAVEAELEEARGRLQRVHVDGSRPISSSERPVALPASIGVDDVRALRAQIATLEARVEALTRERERARETLLRLQAQRDEASRVALELKRSLTPPPGAIGTPRVEADRGSDAQRVRSAPPARAAAGEIAAPASESRASALARALAATHPLRRESEPPDRGSGDPAPPAAGPGLPLKPDDDPQQRP